MSKEGESKKLKLVLKGEEMVFDELLWAVGRAPEIASLDLGNIGVETNAKGHVVVDKY